MRLIDLHCNWALQYAGETVQYDPALYADVRARLGQVEGYMTGAAAAVLTCGRRAGDWARQPDPWCTLAEMITRYEAEYCGRLLLGPEDVARWTAEPPDGMCWGILGIEGFDALVRQPDDLDRLAGLFARGVRVFQLVETGAAVLGGAAVPGDDRGLTELGHEFLDRLVELAPPADQPGPRPVVDLADLNPRTTSDVLAWFEGDSTRHDRLLLVRSHGAIEMPGRDGQVGLWGENLNRFRTLGGVVGLSTGPPFFHSPDELRGVIEAVAGIPFEGRAGYEGIGMGTDFLNLEQTLSHLENVPRLAEWLTRNFSLDVAARLACGNARKLLLHAAGCAVDRGHGSQSSLPGGDQRELSRYR